MSDLSSLETKKIGGVKVVYLGAVVAVALGFYAYRTHAANKGAATVATAGTADPATGEATPVEQPTFTANPAQVSSTDSTTATDSTYTAPTNDTWSASAIAWLVGQGHDVQSSTDTITKYLNGDSLSYGEGQLRDAAVKEFGVPPVPPTGGSVGLNPATAKKQGNPPTHHTVKGAGDNSFSKLALIYYGAASKDFTTTLRAANPTLTASVLPTGTVVMIPAFSHPYYFKATSRARTAYDIAAKNGTTEAHIIELNPGVNFPVRVGTSVRVR